MFCIVWSTKMSANNLLKKSSRQQQQQQHHKKNTSKSSAQSDAKWRKIARASQTLNEITIGLMNTLCIFQFDWCSLLYIPFVQSFNNNHFFCSCFLFGFDFYFLQIFKHTRSVWRQPLHHLSNAFPRIFFALLFFSFLCSGLFGWLAHFSLRVAFIAVICLFSHAGWLAGFHCNVCRVFPLLPIPFIHFCAR